LLCETSRMERTVQDANAVIHGVSVPGLVMRELQHRMANILIILQANCRLEFGNVADPQLRESLRRHEIQMLRLAELHHFLSRGPSRPEVEALDYLRPLCAVLSRSVLMPLGIRCEAFASEEVLPGATCEWLGLIIAELVMNAAKHGFPAGTGGCVRVELLPQNETNWCCTVSDNGCGMSNAKSGTGSQIINSLVQMLGGQIAFQTGVTGTTAIVLFPSRGSLDERENAAR